MYDYVIQIALDRTSQTYVQNLRNCIRQNNIVDRQRGGFHISLWINITARMKRI